MGTPSIYKCYVPNMKDYLLNTWFVVILICAVAAISLYCSFQLSDFSWFGRSGSIITIFGILLTIKHSIFSPSRDSAAVVRETQSYAKFAPEKDSDIYKEQLASAKTVIRDEYIGFTITIVGTGIWGYGDLVAHFFA